MGLFPMGGGGASASMQDAYDNSTAPHVETTTPLGAVTIKRGSASDSDEVITVQNGAGVSTFSVTGDGEATATSGVIIDNTEGLGIRLDVDSPDYGWEDWLSAPVVRGAGGADPVWAVWNGGIRAYQYAGLDETTHNFHVTHDYAPGTDIHIHVHWSQIVADTGAGTPGDVEWLFEVTYAKGHQQMAFIAPVSTSVVQTASGTVLQHMIAEVQLTAAVPTANQFASSLLEVDGLIMVRVSRSNGANDTLNQLPFVHSVDVHYRSTGIATKNKTPDFYI